MLEYSDVLEKTEFNTVTVTPDLKTKFHLEMPSQRHDMTTTYNTHSPSNYPLDEFLEL